MYNLFIEYRIAMKSGFDTGIRSIVIPNLTIEECEKRAEMIKESIKAIIEFGEDIAFTIDPLCDLNNEVEMFKGGHIDYIHFVYSIEERIEDTKGE